MARGGGQGSGAGGVACLVCLMFLFCIFIAIMGVVAMTMAIWQVVDTLHTNSGLMDVAVMAVKDTRLIHAVYLFMAFSILSLCYPLMGSLGMRNKEGEGNAGTGASVWTLVFAGVITAGLLASGVLAAFYHQNTIPGIEAGMVTMVTNQSYMNMTSAVSAPEYTTTGQTLNYLQAKYQCCGVSKPYGGDYRQADWPRRYNLTLPYSCCVLRSKDASFRQPHLDDVLNYAACVKYNPDFYHNATCLGHVTDWLTYKCNFLVGYNFALVFMALSLVILLCCIAICAKC